jgi:hypothetical protein
MLDPLVRTLAELNPEERNRLFRLGLVARFSSFDDVILGGLWGPSADFAALREKVVRGGVMLAAAAPAVTSRKGSWFQVTRPVARELADELSRSKDRKAARALFGSWGLEQLKALSGLVDETVQAELVSLYADAIIAAGGLVFDDYMTEVEAGVSVPSTLQRAHTLAVRSLKLMAAHPRLRNYAWCSMGAMTAAAKGDQFLQARFARGAGIIAQDAGEPDRAAKNFHEAFRLFSALRKETWARDVERRLKPATGLMGRVGTLLSPGRRDDSGW